MTANTSLYASLCLYAILAAFLIATFSGSAWAQNPAPSGPATTIGAATIKPSVLPAGQAFKMIYYWKAVPMGADHTVFVHVINSAGTTVFQDDHAPAVGTSQWSGLVTYKRTVDVPANLPDGVYTIVAGLYSATSGGGWTNYPLIAGHGVKALDNNSYQIGSFTVDHNAPDPPLDSDGPVTLNLKGYHLTFDEEFKNLDVSAWGPGTRWIAHTPYHGDFGDATFADPGPDSPFSVKDGLLNIEAKKVNGKWQAGLLSSADPQGNGFSQTYGYFECCAKFPKGPGTWPAFWMGSTNGLKKLHPEVAEPEIDVVEQYGQWPNQLHTTLHLWGPGKQHVAWGDHFAVADMTAGFHRYGVLWDKKNIIWYFDGVEMYRLPTPPEARYPMYLMVNLALGSGWPIDHTPDPSIMQVKYIRAYAKNGTGNGAQDRTASEPPEDMK